MPRVTTVKSARKPQGDCGHCGKQLGVGQPYIWWQFRYRPKLKRCTEQACYPRRSELTQSEILADLWDAVDDADDAAAKATTIDELVEIKSEAAERIQEVAGMVEGKVENMVEGFGHETSSSDELAERGSAIEGFGEEVEEAFDVEPFDSDTWHDEDEQLTEYRDALTDALSASPE